MNRHRVISEELTFRETQKVLNTEPQTSINDVLTIDSIIKFSKDKKNIKSDRKRKALTLEMLLEYLDDNYNVDDFF